MVNKCKLGHKEKNVVTVTNNNVKYYENLAKQHAEESKNFSNKSGIYSDVSKSCLKFCEELRDSLEAKTVSMLDEATENMTNTLDTSIEKITSIINEKEEATNTTINAHIENTNNPHNVTSEQVGAYSISEIDAILTNKLAQKNPNLVAGQNITISENEDGTQTISSVNIISMDYNIVENKPSINGVILCGNKLSSDLGLQPAGDYVTNSQLALAQSEVISEIPKKVSDLQNDCGYINQHQDVSGQAKTDLSNLTDAGKKVIDGQWVKDIKELSTATAKGTYSIDLSGYLPNDNYSYEVIFNLNFRKTDTTGSSLHIDGITYSINSSAGSVGGRTNRTIFYPIGLNRTFTYSIEDSNASQNTITAMFYRRIGTNS